MVGIELNERKNPPRIIYDRANKLLVLNVTLSL